jgi:hypothetical protein
MTFINHSTLMTVKVPSSPNAILAINYKGQDNKCISYHFAS